MAGIDVRVGRIAAVLDYVEDGQRFLFAVIWNEGTVDTVPFATNGVC